MPILESPGRPQPTAEDGARRIKQTLFHTVNQMDQGLAQVRRIIDRHGKAEIAAALGGEAAELQQVYNKIKATIAALDSTREVPDLP